MAEKSRPRLTTRLVKDTPAPATGATILWDRDLKGFGVAVDPAQFHSRQNRVAILFDKTQLCLLQRRNVLLQEGSLLSFVRLKRCIPVPSVAPVNRVRKSRANFAIPVPHQRAPAVIEVQMSQKNIGDLLRLTSLCPQVLNQRSAARFVMIEKLRVLFRPHPGIDQQTALSFLHQQTTHGPGAEIAFVRRIGFLPQIARNHSKHRAAVEFEVSSVDGGQSHAAQWRARRDFPPKRCG